MMENGKHILIFALAFGAALFVFMKLGKKKCPCGCE